MIEEDSSLFQIRINEEGKKYIRRFASISYLLMVLVFFGLVSSIYLNVRMLVISRRFSAGSFHDMTYPYAYLLISLLAIVSNFYYLRFPQILARCIRQNDEYGANRAFKILMRGALFFLAWLVISTIEIAWSLSVSFKAH